MELQSGEAPGGGHSAAETETDERTFYDSTTFRPTSSPGVREADEDMAPDDADAQTRPAAGPAENYPDADDVDEPVEAPAAVDAGEPAGNYAHPETDEAAPVDETLAAHEMSTTGTAELVPAAPAVAVADLNQPLLTADTELLARWHRVQLGFIDNPQVAVADAADLIEQGGRALVEALRERQRQMRTMWDHSSTDEPTAQGDTADTEQLRQMMQRYQALFTQLYQPV